MTIDAQPNTDIYNLMLKIYLKNEQPESAWALYQQLKSSSSSSVSVRPDWKTYLIMMRSLQGDDSVVALKKQAALKDDMEQLGIEIKAAHLDAMGLDAKEAMKQITLTNYDVNTLMAAAMKNNKFNDAWTIYNNYFRRGCTHHQRHSMLTPNLYTYTMAMRALIKSSNKPTSQVFDIYGEMKRNGIDADKVVYSCLLQACIPSGDMDKAIGFLDDMRLARIPLNDVLFSSLVLIASNKLNKTESDMAQLAAVWDEIAILEPLSDIVLCNRYLALLATYTPGIADDAPTTKLPPASTAVAQSDEDINLTGPPMSSTAKQMMSVYRTMRQDNSKARPDPTTYSILITAMVNQHQVRQAMVLFRNAQRTTKGLRVADYNTLMHGLLTEDDPNPIMYLWRDMKDRQIWPDRTTYNLVLDACEKLGLVEPFKMTLAQMQTDGARLDRLDAKQK
jgi:pentatricopeptide repeat protein